MKIMLLLQKKKKKPQPLLFDFLLTWNLYLENTP